MFFSVARSWDRPVNAAGEIPATRAPIMPEW
jgi:hypothetical protein